MMKRTDIVRNVWLTAAVAAVVMSVAVWFGAESEAMRQAVLVCNAVAFVLALPVTLAAVPVGLAANHYLEINMLSAGGIHLNSFLLLGLGAAQWFLIANQFRPFESRMARLGI